MKKIDLGQTITILANVGVIAGIVFLAFEVRQNSEALLAGSRQDLLNADLQLLDNLMDYPQLYDPASYGSLTGADLSRRDVYFVSTLRIREFAWQQYKNGAVDQDTLESYLEPLKFIFNAREGHEFLLSRQYAGDPEFEDFVIEYLEVRE